MDAQDRVAAFFERHELEGRPTYQALDLASEVGEIAETPPRRRRTANTPRNCR